MPTLTARSRTKTQRCLYAVIPPCDLIQSWLCLSKMFIQVCTLTSHKSNHTLCLRSKRSTRHMRYIYNPLAAVLRKRLRECQVEMFGSTTQGSALYSRCCPFDAREDRSQGLVPNSLKVKRGRVRRGYSNSGAEHVRVPIASVQTKPEFGSLRVDIVVDNTDGRKVVPVVQEYARIETTANDRQGLSLSARSEFSCNWGFQ